MAQLINANLISQWIKPRAFNAHKGDFGRLLIIAGQKGMMGAALLCAKAAFKTGAGLVTVSCDEELFPVVHSSLPEAMCKSREGLEFSAYDAIAIGPGLGVSLENYELITRLLEEYSGPVVLDADGLNNLARFGIPKTINSQLVITPHIAEAARLLNADMYVLGKNRDIAALMLSDMLGCVSVIKGARSRVFDTDFGMYENVSGNPGMASGGSGDVLTGIMGALAARFSKDEECENPQLCAALAAVYVHGLAGDIAAAILGEDGLSASDLVAFTALAMKNIAENYIENENNEE